MEKDNTVRNPFADSLKDSPNEKLAQEVLNDLVARRAGALDAIAKDFKQTDKDTNNHLSATELESAHRKAPPSSYDKDTLEFLQGNYSKIAGITMFGRNSHLGITRSDLETVSTLLKPNGVELAAKKANDGISLGIEIGAPVAGALALGVGALTRRNIYVAGTVFIAGTALAAYAGYKLRQSQAESYYQKKATEVKALQW